jgi:hypothetical protein
MMYNGMSPIDVLAFQPLRKLWRGTMPQHRLCFHSPGPAILIFFSVRTFINIFLMAIITAQRDGLNVPFFGRLIGCCFKSWRMWYYIWSGHAKVPDMQILTNSTISTTSRHMSKTMSGKWPYNIRVRTATSHTNINFKMRHTKQRKGNHR